MTFSELMFLVNSIRFVYFRLCRLDKGKTLMLNKISTVFQTQTSSKKFKSYGKSRVEALARKISLGNLPDVTSFNTNFIKYSHTIIHTVINPKPKRYNPNKSMAA